LRKTAARRRPQNDGLHGKSGLDLSASVAVDFTTQRDFHDFRGVPGHTSLLLCPLCGSSRYRNGFSIMDA
jgi:hypothetical protein